jgi:predicted GTPase
MGYGREQMEELRETIESVPCDIVLVATPVDLAGLLGLSKEGIRVSYEIQELNGKELKGHIEGFVDSYFHIK